MFKRFLRAIERIPAITAPLFVALFGGFRIGLRLRQKYSRPKNVRTRALPAIGLTKEIVDELPRHSFHASARPMESMNIIMIGTKSELRRLYAAAGWYEALPVSFWNLLRAQLSIMLNAQFLRGPVTPLYVGINQNDLAFQKPTTINKFRQRHHMRLWKTQYHAATGQPIWIGQASYDIGIKQTGSLIKVPAHEIDPDINAERDLLRSDLLAAGGTDYGYIKLQDEHKGINAFDDKFFADGRAAVVGVDAG